MGLFFFRFENKHSGIAFETGRLRSITQIAKLQRGSQFRSDG